MMAKKKYEEENGVYKGKRADSPFEDDMKQIQTDMRDNWKISIIPIEDSYAMYFTEFFLACELKTKWNTFETH